MESGLGLITAIRSAQLLPLSWQADIIWLTFPTANHDTTLDHLSTIRKPVPYCWNPFVLW